MSPPCLMAAWSACEAELRSYLSHRIGHLEDAQEVLQEVFIKAMRQDERFCDVDNPRAWFFQVARNALAERLGLSLSGAKSRLQRARLRLRQQMEKACQVRYDESGAVCGFTPRPPLSAQ